MEKDTEEKYCKFVTETTLDDWFVKYQSIDHFVIFIQSQETSF